MNLIPNLLLKLQVTEYQRIQEIKNIGARFIVPVNFPEAYDVEDPFDAESISLADLKHWELAPTNVASFEKNNIHFCFTSFDLKDKSFFLETNSKSHPIWLESKNGIKSFHHQPCTVL